MSKRDYYEILGVSRTSTEIELKAAFRKLAMQHHPDRNPGDKECEHRFKEINEAYDVLRDGDKRAAYDRFGHARRARPCVGSRQFASRARDGARQAYAGDHHAIESGNRGADDLSAQCRFDGGLETRSRGLIRLLPTFPLPNRACLRQCRALQKNLRQGGRPS